MSSSLIIYFLFTDILFPLLSFVLLWYFCYPYWTFDLLALTLTDAYDPGCCVTSASGILGDGARQVSFRILGGGCCADQGFCSSCLCELGRDGDRCTKINITAASFGVVNWNKWWRKNKLDNSIIQMCSGIKRGRVLDGEFYAQLNCICSKNWGEIFMK